MDTTEERRRAILAEIGAIGPVLPGSIVERSTRCQSSGCHCRADPPQLHGPYATWMRQHGGRQVTTTLTAAEAETMRPLIAADRRLKDLVRELEQLTVTELMEDRSQPTIPLGKKPPEAGKR